MSVKTAEPSIYADQGNLPAVTPNRPGASLDMSGLQMTPQLLRNTNPGSVVERQVFDAGRGFVRGVPALARSVAGAGEAVESMLPATGTPGMFREMREQLLDPTMKALPQTQELTGGIVESLPSVAAAFVPGMAATRLAGPVAGMVAGSGAAAAQSGGQQFADATGRMRDLGANYEQASQIGRAEAATVGAFTAATSLPVFGRLVKAGIPPNTAVQRIVSALPEPVKRLAGKFGVPLGEAAQEGSEQAVQMAVQAWAESDPQAFENWQQQIIQATVAGGIVGTGAAAAMRGLNRGGAEQAGVSTPPVVPDQGSQPGAAVTSQQQAATEIPPESSASPLPARSQAAESAQTLVGDQGQTDQRTAPPQARPVPEATETEAQQSGGSNTLDTPSVDRVSSLNPIRSADVLTTGETIVAPSGREFTYARTLDSGKVILTNPEGKAFLAGTLGQMEARGWVRNQATGEQPGQQAQSARPETSQETEVPPVSAEQATPAARPSSVASDPESVQVSSPNPTPESGRVGPPPGDVAEPKPTTASKPQEPAAAIVDIKYAKGTDGVMDTEGNIYATVREVKKRNGAVAYEVLGYSKRKGKHPDLEGMFEARTKADAMEAAREIARRESGIAAPVPEPPATPKVAEAVKSDSQSGLTETPVPQPNTPGFLDAVIAKAEGRKKKMVEVRLKRQPNQPAKDKGPATPWSKRDIEDRIASEYATSAANAVDTTLALQEEGNASVSNSFAGPIPTEVREAIAHRPELMTMLRANKKGATGEDYLGEVGVDAFVASLERQFKNKLDKQKDGLRNDPNNPVGRFLAALHDNLPRGKRPAKETLDAASIKTGTEFTIDGHNFRVETQGDGIRVLKDGKDFPTVELDAFSQLPVDKGSVEVPKSRVKPAQGSLLGERFEGGITGKQRGLMDIETVDFSAPLSETYPGIRKNETVQQYQKRMGTTDTPSFVESAADATIAAAEARKAERRKTLAEARRKAKPGERSGSSILPDIVDDVVIVAAKAIKAGARTVAQIKQIVREHLGTDNQEVMRRAYRLVRDSEDQSGKNDQAKFAKNVEDLFGRPDLANPAVDPEARKFVDQVDAERNAEGKPETRADKTVEQQAEDRIAKDYDGEKRKLLEAAAKGTTPTDVDTVIARRIVEDSALKAVRDEDPQAFKEAMEIANAYRDQGTEIARAFRQRRDKVLGPEERAAASRAALANIITTPEPRIRRILAGIAERLKAARVAGDEAKIKVENERRDRVLAAAAKRSVGIKKALKKAGIDIDTIDLTNSEQVARTARTVSAAQSSVWDMIHEYWINSILSGPLTHVANITGNTVFGAFDLGVTKLAEAGVAKIPGLSGPDAPTFGEWAATWRGFLPSLSEATHNFARAWATEMPVFADSSSAGTQSDSVKGDLSTTAGRAAIPGTLGRVVRVPGRTLLATDEFFKTIYSRMVIHGEAYRAARREGLKGEAAANRAADLTANPTDNIWQAAVTEAERLTFQTPSEFANSLGKLRDSVPGLRYVVPFIRTPLRIFESAIDKTPLGIVLTAGKIARAGLVKMNPALDNGEWTYTKRDAGRGIANGLLAIGATAILAGLMDDDEPMITGSAARESGKREGQYRTAPPYSVRIGDSWYSYRRIEPFGTSLSSTVDLIEAYKRADTPEKKMSALAGAVTGVGKAALDKTFLKGLGDLVTALSNQSGTGKEAAKWASDFAVSFVPNIVRQPMAAADSTLRDRSVRVDDAGYAKPLASVAVRKAFAPWMLPPKMDIWGRTVENRPTGHVASDVLYRMFSPIQKSDATATVAADRLLTNWNNKAESDPDGVLKPWWPTAPDNLVTVGGQKYRLTEDEYVRYVKKSGENALKWIGTLSEQRIANPTETDINTIKRMLQKARATEAVLIVSDRKRAARKPYTPAQGDSQARPQP
jgi:hypothetical protein